MNKLLKAIYHSEKEVAEFIAEDGQHLLRSGGTLPWRIFNSGDLVSPVNSRGEPNPKHTKNYIGFAHGRISGNDFFIFPDYETGRAELKASLKRKYINLSIEDTIVKYAPNHENNTEKYINDVCKVTGLSKDTKIKELDDAQLNQVMDAIELVEGFHNKADTRKETWVSVSQIQATDGKSPIAGEEIVVKSKGKEQILKSNEVGYFPPIVHTEPTEIFHKTADADLIKVGDLPADKGINFSLLTNVAEYFSYNAPVTPPENPIKLKHPQTYTVQPGDTLSKIAAKFKISVTQLKQDNHLMKDVILSGQVLGIHTAAPAVIAKTKAKKAIPKVKKEHKKHAVESTEQAKTLPARSKEGEGEPLALIPPEEGVAPWMKYAIAEAKRWHGEPEGIIQKGKPANDKTGEEAIDKINYHSELGYKSRSMATVAWCAAFANWCLMQAGYPIDKTPHSARAKAFYMHNDSKTQNPMYIEIDEPIYGAIGLVTHADGKNHVGFAYAKMDDKHIVLLGGNQSDLIRFSPFGMKPKKSGVEFTRFFVPLAYAEQAKKDADNRVIEAANPAVLNKSFGIKEPPPKKHGKKIKSDTE
jgi:uncharacterized protein (TIGR02594 family)